MIILDVNMIILDVDKDKSHVYITMFEFTTIILHVHVEGRNMPL